VVHAPRKKLLDFGGNPDHIALGLGVGQGTAAGTIKLAEARAPQISDSERRNEGAQHKSIGARIKKFRRKAPEIHVSPT